MALRRCHEDREFTKADNHMWPMFIQEGGTPYSSCPGKATWDQSAVSLFRMLVVSAETGAMYEAGGIGGQPDWFIDLLGWFLPQYNGHKQLQFARLFLGDGGSSAKPVGPTRTPAAPRRR